MADFEPSMTAGTANSGKPNLMDRLRQRHIDALTSFQTACREASAAIDNEVFERFRELRTVLTVGRSDCEARLADTEAGIQSHKVLLQQHTVTFNNKDVGTLIEPLIDDIHPPGEPFLATLEQRGTRLEAARRSVLNLALELREAHQIRMDHLDSAEAFIANAEARRRTTMKAMLEKLLETLSSIAYVGTTVSQLLVHRAAVSVNQQLVRNDVSTKELLTKLRQLDILKHRGYQNKVAELYHTKLEVLAESVSLWSRQLLWTPYFRTPSCRVDILHRAESVLRQTNKDVANLINGVGILIDTLSRNPHGIGSPVNSEIPSGAVPSGWLQFFDHNQRTLVPFNGGPEAVSEQWLVSVTVVLQQLKFENGRAVDDAVIGERAIQQQAAQVHHILLNDIESIFTPSEEELEVIRKAAFDPLTQVTVPFDSAVVPNPTRAATLQAQATELLEPHIASLATEGGWFIDALVMNQFLRGSALVHTLLGPVGGLVPIIHDATQALYAVAVDIASLMRQQFATHEAAYKDFVDACFRLEQAYQITEDHLVHAGTVQLAQELCIAAMDLLKKIEAQYCQHHSSRTAMLPTFTSQLQQLLSNATSRIIDDVYVVPLADVKRRNDALEREVAAAKERLKQLGNKEKGAKLVEAQAALQAAQEKMAKELVSVEGQPIASVAVGDTVVEYVAPHPTFLKYGAADQVANSTKAEKPKEVAAPSSAKELKAARAAGKAAGKAASSAASVNATSVSELTAGDENGLPELPVWTPHARHFIKTLRDSFSPIFHDECLVSKTAVHQVIAKLRTAMLGWVAEYSGRAMRRAVEFCTLTKETVDEETNEAIRRHYRRPPTLQSQVYELRLRELQDALQSRSKYFAWIQQRIATCATNSRTAVDGTHQPIANDLAKLQDLQQQLAVQHAIPAVEANNRTAQALIQKAQTHAVERLESAQTHLVQALDVIRKECRTFADERLRSFEEGGDLSQEEKAKGLQDIKDLIALSQSTESDGRIATQGAKESHLKNIATASAQYQAAFEHNLAELKFLARLQELIGSAKGKLIGQITTSTNSLKQLETLVATAEELIGTSSTSVRKDYAANAVLDTIEWTKTAAAPPANVVSRLPALDSVAVDETWEQLDVCLSERLRSTKVIMEASLNSSRAFKILEAMDELRKHLYNRGLYLGCLTYGCDITPVPADTYFDPPKQIEAPLAAGAPSTSTAGGAKGAGGKAATAAAGAKGAPASSNKTDSAPSPNSNDDPDAWGQFAKVLRWDHQFAKSLQVTRDSTVTALEYFATRPGPLIRKEPFGADLAAVKASMAAKFTTCEQKLAEHNTAQITQYRILVQRVHLLSHRFAGEVLASLANVTADSLDARCEDVLTVFAAYYWALGAARTKASAQLKGSMNAPSSRGRLDAVSTKEHARQQRALQVVRVTGGALIRETQDEAFRFATRASQALACVFTMLRSLVSPEHLVPGEEVTVGEHKSIKKLLRQRMKEESAKALEATTANKPGQTGGAAAKGGAKPDAKKAAKEDPKAKGGKGASAKTEEDDTALPILDRPLNDYAGIRSNAVRPLDGWKRANGDVLLRDHYEPPSVWAVQDAERSQAAAAPEVAAGKKGAPAPGGKTAPPAKAGAAKTAVADPSASTIEVDPVITPTLTAPADRVYQAGWLSRQQLVETVNDLTSQLAQHVDAKVKELSAAEVAWMTSWRTAVEALVAGVEASAK